MGRIYKFIGGQLCDMCEACNYNKTGAFSFNYKDIQGTQYLSMYVGSSNFRGAGYFTSTAVLHASADGWEDLSVNDYSFDDIGGVATTIIKAEINRYVTEDGYLVTTMPVTIKNSGADAVTIKSLKKVGSVYKDSSSSVQVLQWAYVFDEPITVEAGETKTVIMILKANNEV